MQKIIWPQSAVDVNSKLRGIFLVFLKGEEFLPQILIKMIMSIFFLVDMTRGRSWGRAGHASKISIRGRDSTSRVNMPTISISKINSQLGGGPDHINQIQTLAPTSLPPVQTSSHDSNPSVHSEPAPTIPNQSNTRCGGSIYSEKHNRWRYIESEQHNRWRWEQQ